MIADVSGVGTPGEGDWYIRVCVCAPKAARVGRVNRHGREF